MLPLVARHCVGLTLFRLFPLEFAMAASSDRSFARQLIDYLAGPDMRSNVLGWDSLNREQQVDVILQAITAIRRDWSDSDTSDFPGSLSLRDESDRYVRRFIPFPSLPFRSLS